MGALRRAWGFVDRHVGLQGVLGYVLLTPLLVIMGRVRWWLVPLGLVGVLPAMLAERRKDLKRARERAEVDVMVDALDAVAHLINSGKAWIEASPAQRDAILRGIKTVVQIRTEWKLGSGLWGRQWDREWEKIRNDARDTRDERE